MLKICIDPGHGGSDPGACASAAQEKQIVLEIGKKLKKQLVANGFPVVMTREDDRFDTPHQKAQKANQAGADLFVSLHCNSSTAEQAHGAETFAYGTAGKGYELAKAIQKELVTASGLVDRGVKNGQNLIVLNSTSMPAVLVETAFISNKEERLLLLAENFQNKIATAICKAICGYCGIKEKEKNQVMEQNKAPEWKERSVQEALKAGILNQYHDPLEPVDMGTLCTMLLTTVKKEAVMEGICG